MRQHRRRSPSSQRRQARVLCRRLERNKKTHKKQTRTESFLGASAGSPNFSLHDNIIISLVLSHHGHSIHSALVLLLTGAFSRCPRWEGVRMRQPRAPQSSDGSKGRKDRETAWFWEQRRTWGNAEQCGGGWRGPLVPTTTLLLPPSSYLPTSCS